MAEALLVGERAAPAQTMTLVDTPNQKTIADVCQFLNSDAKQSVKALLVQGQTDENGNTPVVALFYVATTN